MMMSNQESNRQAKRRREVSSKAQDGASESSDSSDDEAVVDRYRKRPNNVAGGMMSFLDEDVSSVDTDANVLGRIDAASDADNATQVAQGLPTIHEDDEVDTNVLLDQLNRGDWELNDLVDTDAIENTSIENNIDIEAVGGDEEENNDFDLNDEGDNFNFENTWNIFDQQASTSASTDSPEANAPIHWRGMKWNKELKEFEPEDEDFEVDDRWPDLDKWMKISPKESKGLRAVFNKGRQTMVVQYVKEYQALHRRLEELDIDKSRKGLFAYLYGKETSLLADTLTRALSIEYAEFTQFLATFYFAASFRTAFKRLEDNPFVQTDYFMKSERYNEIWNKIATAGVDGNDEKLWEVLQDVLNRTLRLLFLTDGNMPKTMRIALDDDKIHYHYALKKLRECKDYLLGMKGCQHVKANLRGFTCDTAVSTASGFPLHLSILRQGETNTDNYKQMVEFMFQHRMSQGDQKSQALAGIIFCSDRGYWNVPLILWLLSFRAFVFGTLMRQWWIPYTYNQTKLNGREKIETEFGRSCFRAYVRVLRWAMKVLAWRSGTGAVSLALNSDNEGEEEKQEMDFCFKHHGDAKWYKSTIPLKERVLKAFTVVLRIKHPQELITNVEKYLVELATDTVMMLTVSDLCLVWFTLRMFAMTSSTAELSLRYSSPYIEATESIYPRLEMVMKYAGLERFLKGSNDT